MSARGCARSAWFFLITVVTIIYRSAGEPSQMIVCSQPNNFTVQITENEHVVVYGIELLIRYDPRVGIFSFPKTDPANVVFNASTIEFQGYMLPEYPVTRSGFSPERLSWISNGIILGIGTLQKLSSENYVVRECRLFLPTNIKSSANIPFAVENKIIYYAHLCVRTRLCYELGTIQEEELRNINRYDELEPNAFIPRVIQPNDLQKQNFISNHSTNVDLRINVPVDIALKSAIKYIEHNGKSVIKIPDVNETHVVGPFKIKCNFQAIDGTFQDLSTIKRTEDAFLSNVGQTYVVRGGFGLSTAKFNYDHYKLKLGFVTVNGKIVGTVEGLALATSIAIDYDKTCAVNLKYIKVTKFGTVKIKVSGLGPLNNLTSKLLTWLTKMWQNDIVKHIQVHLKKIAEKELSKYICQNFNSAIIT